MPEDFFRKQNHRGSARQFFFNLTVEKPLKNVSRYTPLYLPFTAKRGQLGQSCKGKSCMKISWRLFEMNIMMIGAVDEFLKCFWPRLWHNKGLKPPNGWFCLRKFLDRKRRLARKRLSLTLIFKKCQNIFSENKITAGALGKIFLPWSLKNLWKKCVHVYAFVPPFTAKRGHFRQSCQGKSCMKFSWHVFEMNIVIKERKEGRKEKEEGRKRRKEEEKEEEGKGKERKKVGSFRFFFLRHFIFFQTRIGIFAGHRGSSGQIFFTLVDEKPLKKVVIYMPGYVPFTAKTDHFRQSW